MDLNVPYPNKARLLADDKKTVNVTTINPDEEDRALITIPADSRPLRALADDPVERHKKLHLALRDECGLDPQSQYAVMSIYPKNEHNLVTGYAENFLISINQENFHEMGMGMLKKLADPRIGSAFSHNGNEEAYRNDIADPDSHTTQIIAHIVINAKPAAEELDELRTQAARKENYEFCSRIIELGDLLYPGFAKARSKRQAGGPESRHRF